MEQAFSNNQPALPLHLAVMLRCLDPRDDCFVRGTCFPVSQFRSGRRKIFRESFEQTKRYLLRLQQRRRDLQAQAGSFDMRQTLESDLAFTIVLLELRFALALHYVNASMAASLTESACGRLRDSLNSAALAAEQRARFSPI